MEEGWNEFAFGRLGRIFVWKGEREFEETAFPDGLLSSWNANFPHLEVDHAVKASVGFGEEAERVVFAPLLPLLTKSI